MLAVQGAQQTHEAETGRFLTNLSDAIKNQRMT